VACLTKKETSLQKTMKVDKEGNALVSALIDGLALAGVVADMAVHTANYHE